jgi:hypothetical protein
MVTRTPRVETDTDGVRTAVTAFSVTETWEERVTLESVRAQIAGSQSERVVAQQQVADLDARIRELQALEALLTRP